MKHEIVLSFCAICGFAAMATPVWTTSFEDSYFEAYQESANRLNHGAAITYGCGVKKCGPYANELTATDGDVSTYTSKGKGVETGEVIDFCLTNDNRSAVNVTELRLYSKWSDTGRVTFSLSNLKVKYFGSDSFVEIPNTADARSTGRPSTTYMYANLVDDADEPLASSVTDIRLTFRQCQNDGAGMAEIEVIGEGCEVPKNPIGSVSFDCAPTSADIIASLNTPGPTSPSADFYFAFAKDGETVPAPSLVKAGMVADEVYTNIVTGLDDYTTYNYVGYFTNSVGGHCELSGSFKTISHCKWVSSSYDGVSWAMPTNTLMGCITNTYANLANGMVYKGTDYEHCYYPNATCEWTFAEAKDITAVDIYMGGAARFQIHGVDVRYAGDDSEYHELRGTGLYDYWDFGKNVMRVTLSRIDGVNVAENIVGIRVRFGGFAESYRALAEICPIGRDHAQNCQYDFGSCSNDTYAASKNWLKKAKQESGEAAPAALFDKDIATSTLDDEWSGGTLVWSFTKPRNIESLRLITSPDSTKSYQGYKLTGFYVKHQGDADYSIIAGSKLNEFRCFKSKTNIATLRNYDPTAKLAENVVACRITLEPVDGETKINLAEIELCGDPPYGFMIIVR